MWNYVFFIAYLKYKNENNDCGDESYIRKKLNSKDLNWIPFNRSIELSETNQNINEESNFLNNIENKV